MSVIVLFPILPSVNLFSPSLLLTNPWILKHIKLLHENFEKNVKVLISL